MDTEMGIIKETEKKDSINTEPFIERNGWIIQAGGKGVECGINRTGEKSINYLFDMIRVMINPGVTVDECNMISSKINRLEENEREHSRLICLRSEIHLKYCRAKDRMDFKSMKKAYREMLEVETTLFDFIEKNGDLLMYATDTDHHRLTDLMGRDFIRLM
ncbi:MAG: hypothetical protein LBT50_09810 [Prevotellaceae bacterium]|jgi:hypothetical protein|nr:hypothetical protein [Prevotellaceae bacterium]